MSRAPRARLVRTENPRTATRHRVSIAGRLGIGERPAADILVTDLGPKGCSLQGDAVGVTRAIPLTLWLGEVGPIAGKLKWAKAGSVGVMFDAPLDDEVLGALREAATRGRIVPKPDAEPAPPLAP